MMPKIDCDPWIATSAQLPPDGLVVDTKIDDANGCRNEQPLKRQGRLWFLPHGDLYVYYKPTHWREVGA
jgi:hypothetical protein